MYCNNYIKGDTNEDGSRYLPFDDDNMYYDNERHQYILKESAITNNAIVFSSNFSFKIIAEEISDQLYEFGGENPYMSAYDLFEFKAARTARGRNGIYKAMVAQLRYATRTGKNLDEYGDSISKRAKSILYGEQSGKLAYAGKGLIVNPDSTDDDGYRNGY